MTRQKLSPAILLPVANQEQIRHLRHRLADALNRHRRAVKELPPDPHVEATKKTIKRLNKIVRRFEDKNSRHCWQQRDKIDRIMNKVQSAILFENPQAALRAVKTFEKLKFT